MNAEAVGRRRWRTATVLFVWWVLAVLFCWACRALPSVVLDLKGVSP